MSKETDDMVLNALRQHHGTIIIDNPSKALLAVGKENTELHEEVDRLWRELDIYRNALTVIAYLDPGLLGPAGISTTAVELAFSKCQSLAKAALLQILMGSSDLALLRQAMQRQTDG